MIELPTKSQVTVRIIGIVSASGFFILALLSKSSLQLSFFQDAVLNIFSLVILATPVIYFWVIKPFVKAHNQAIDQIQQMSWIDPLTQLANRQLILCHMKKTLSNAIRHKVYGAVMILDLDDFKPINDIHGHGAGDAMLVEIAERLAAATRIEDIIGRLGGDEFVVIMSDLNADKQTALDKAKLIADRIIHAINKPLDFGGKQLEVSASIGIRFLDYEKSATIDQLFSEADSAMYLAKNKGKGNSAFFQEEESVAGSII
jgi:diguanylate cyclase (GGDEF)-like protein